MPFSVSLLLQSTAFYMLYGIDCGCGGIDEGTVLSKVGGCVTD